MAARIGIGIACLGFICLIASAAAAADEPASGPAVVNPRVVCDRWPSNYDAKSWIGDVFRIENAATGEQKAIALYRWVRLMLHWGNPSYEGTRGQSVCECDAVKKINIYPYGFCSDFGVVSAAMGHAGGLKAMEAHIPGHTQFELTYTDADGVERSHRLDSFWGVVCYDRTGGHILGWEEIKADPQAALAPAKTLLPWGDKKDDRSRFAEKGAYKPSLRVRPAVCTMDKSLYAGETYELRWSRREDLAFYNGNPDKAGPQPVWWGMQRFQYAAGKLENLQYGHERLLPYAEVYDKWIRIPTGHGQLTFAPVMGEGFEASTCRAPVNVAAGAAGEPKLRPALAGQAAELVYEVRLPYPILEARLAGRCRGVVDISLALSPWQKQGWTICQQPPKSPQWQQVFHAAGPGEHEVRVDLTPMGGPEDAVSLRGEYVYLVKVEMPAAERPAGVGLDALELTHTFQQAMIPLPRLMPGANAITVAADAIRPGWRLRVEYNWDDAAGKGHTATHLVDRVPFTFQIEAAGRKPADVRTNWLRLNAVRQAGCGTSR